MKSKLTILLLLIWTGLSAQQVPDNNAFSLQDVVNVVNPTSNDLQSCFDNANEGYFDLNYGNGSTPPNSLYEFRNYGEFIPEFVVMAGSFHQVSLMDINGNFKGPTPVYYATNAHWQSDYDPTNKVLIYTAQADYLGIAKLDDLSNLTGKTLSNYDYLNISRAGNYWFAAINNSVNGKYSAVTSYQNLSFTNDIFGSPPTTSATLRKFIAVAGFPITSYYYTTGADEIGLLSTPGGTGTELYDSDTHTFGEMTYQNNIFLAFGTTRRCRYSPNLDNWYNFELNSTDLDPGPAILRALPYTSDFSIALAGDKIYRVTHTDPPIITCLLYTSPSPRD